MTNFEQQKILMDNIQLSPREQEILQLIANEYTSKAIVEALSISMATVESHRRNMIKKCGVKNSIGIVKIGIEKQWI